MLENYKVLGVSAGGGALLHPFLGRIIANVEPRSVFHMPNDDQWHLNFRGVPVYWDKLDDDWSPDVIVSSPDCGASSIMRLSKVKKLGKPEENKSLHLVLTAIEKYKPSVFLIENLPRMLDLLPEGYFKENFPDYKIITHCHSVMEFGNSQKSRKRLIIIGVRRDKPRAFRRAFREVFKVSTPKIVKDLLEPAYNKENYNIPPKKTLAMYDYRKLPDKTTLTVRKIRRLWVGDFKDEYKWPIKTAKMKTLPGVYRLREDSFPLTVRPADRQFRPDGWPLGIEDYKAIMGFPKSFKIYMDEDRYLFYLNKARVTLCKGSVYEVGLWFKKCIENYLNLELPNSLSSRTLH